MPLNLPQATGWLKSKHIKMVICLIKKELFTQRLFDKLVHKTAEYRWVTNKKASSFTTSNLAISFQPHLLISYGLPSTDWKPKVLQPVFIFIWFLVFFHFLLTLHIFPYWITFNAPMNLHYTTWIIQSC